MQNNDGNIPMVNSVMWCTKGRERVVVKRIDESGTFALVFGNRSGQYYTAKFSELKNHEGETIKPSFKVIDGGVKNGNSF